MPHRSDELRDEEHTTSGGSSSIEVDAEAGNLPSQFKHPEALTRQAPETQTETRTQTRPENWKEALTWSFRSTRVVTPEGVRPATLIVRSGKIIKVADWDDVPADAHLNDYGDLVLLPGLVDTHVHINDAEPSENARQQPSDQTVVTASRKNWEGFSTATQAAAAGGVTTLVDMPLNCTPETINLAALEAKRQAGAQTWVDWMSWGGIVGNNGTGGNDRDLPQLIKAGVPGFKCFLVHSGIQTFAWVDEPQLRKAMAILRSTEFRSLELPLLAHAELAEPVERSTARLNAQPGGADWRSYQTYLASRPDEAEIEAIKLLIGLATIFDAPIHVVHLSSARALPLLKLARSAGLKITVETCPHYLWFAAEDIPDGATEFKCAPPIRNAANREVLWQALEEGTIDLIATDHSPCPPELKCKDTGRFDQAWGGIASLGLALPIVWTALHGRKVTSVPHDADSMYAGHTDLQHLARWLCSQPATLAGLTGEKGSFIAGYDADMVIFDPDAGWTVTEADLRFRHKVSPYLGVTLRGKVLETYLRGECIYWGRAAGVIDPAAHGRELYRKAGLPA